MYENYIDKAAKIRQGEEINSCGHAVSRFGYIYDKKELSDLLNNIDVLKDDCKVWLTTILGKYDQSKGTKAFSYFLWIQLNLRYH